jgi:glycosyltransferase involved in cell wall biosynthesis
MKDSIILAGLANNTTSLGEVFRRYVECFQQFSNPDVFDLGKSITNSKFYVYKFPQFIGKIDHDIKYIHTTFHHYHALKSSTKPIKSPKNFKKIGYFVWESSELHDKDVEILKEFDEIWTSSQYCKNTFSQYISDKKVKIIHHPIPSKTSNYTKKQKFTILIMGNVSSNVHRKNLHGNLRVANTIKQRYPDIEIILKTTSVSDSEKQVIKNITKSYHVTIDDSYMINDDLFKLIAQCHIILSLHRSEGFGLTIAEAIELKTVPICTKYSGNLDFITNENLLVDYTLVPVSNDFFKGYWADPDETDAVDKIYNVINSYDSFVHNLPQNNHLSFSTITNKIQETL